MIVIVDYGLGNLRSVSNMLRRAGFESVISGAPDVIRSASKLILPGVGHFGFAMESLHAKGLVSVLNETVLEARIPVLGICLGAQLLGRGSEEGGAVGLDWLPMDVVAFDNARLGPGRKVPHMGWAVTTPTQSALFQGMAETARFYYVHSYHFKCDAPDMVICSASHGYRFASGVGHRNILGVQFHPEKSHAHGQQLLRNFAVMEFAA